MDDQERDEEVRLVPMREVRDRKGKVVRYTHLPFRGSAEDWWNAGITAEEADAVTRQVPGRPLLDATDKLRAAFSDIADSEGEAG